LTAIVLQVTTAWNHLKTMKIQSNIYFKNCTWVIHVWSYQRHTRQRTQPDFYQILT